MNYLRICALIAGFLTVAATIQAAEIKIVEGKDKLQITIDGKPFTTYNFAPTADDPEWHRPYFFPVFSVDGSQLTADRDRETMHDETREHPHHRSVWVGMGDVNGVDHWTHPDISKTPKNPPIPVRFQRHIKFTKLTSESFVEELAWDGKEDGKPVLTETRTVRIVAYPDGARGIDLTSNVTAASGDAVFKVKPLNVSGVEAGWLAVRVPMEVSTNKASLITTSAQTTGEADARAKPSNWCDYSGTIGGKMQGVALFDYPTNPAHPSPFAVRAFGLLTRIGVHDWTLPNGRSQSFRHMLLFHPGDAKSAQLDERYGNFVAEK